MKKVYVFLVALMVLSALALPLSALASHDGSHDAAGTLTAIGAKSVTIHTTTGANVRLKVRATTRISIDNRPAKLSDLKVGNRVDSHYNPLTMIASRLEKQVN